MMNLKNDRERLLARVLTGSRLYELDTPDSDHDYLGIFLKTEEDKLENIPDVIVENGDLYMELHEFARRLLGGDLRCIELLFTPQEKFWYYDTVLDPFIKARYDFICRDSINMWMHTSKGMFSRAVKVGQMKPSPVNLQDYIYVVSDYIGRPISETLTAAAKRGGLNPGIHYSSTGIDVEKYGLYPVVPHLDLYAIYEDLGTKRKEKVLGLFDENYQLIKNGIIEPPGDGYVFSYLQRRGCVIVDKRKFNRDLRIQKMLKDSKIKSGYATKSMLHAFRTLEFTRTWLKYQMIRLQPRDKVFFDRIRLGELSLAELKKHYDGYYSEAEDLLKSYDGQESIDKDILVKALRKSLLSIENKANANQLSIIE